MRAPAWLVTALVALMGGISSAPLSAQESGAGLVEVCRVGLGYSTASGNLCPARSWERPANGKAVLSCGTLATGEACAWGNAQLRYRLWEEIGDDELVVTCEAEVPVGPFSSVDPCGSGHHTTGKPRIPKRLVFGAVAGPIINGRGTVTLSWVPPTQRTDGTPLDNLAGYRIGYGTESRVYTGFTEIDGGGITSAALEFEIDGPTTFYFAIAAIDAGGLESTWSNEVAKRFELELDDMPPDPPTLIEVEFGAEFECTSSDGRVCRFIVQ